MIREEIEGLKDQVSAVEGGVGERGEVADGSDADGQEAEDLGGGSMKDWAVTPDDDEPAYPIAAE